jgi:hypothetical protein
MRRTSARSCSPVPEDQKMSDIAYLGKKTATTSTEGFGSTTSSASNVGLSPRLVKPTTRQAHASKEFEAAVYAYVRAVRTLGRTSITVSEIGKALSLPRSAVFAAVRQLKDKGIKVAG